MLMTEKEWERVENEEIDKRRKETREEQEPACSALSQKTDGVFRKVWNADTISKSCTQRAGTGWVLAHVLQCSSWTALIDKRTPKARIKKESVQCNTAINYLAFCTYRVWERSPQWDADVFLHNRLIHTYRYTLQMHTSPWLLREYLQQKSWQAKAAVE